MVLNFGIGQSIFQSSQEAGFGFGANENQAIIDDGGGFKHWWDNLTPFDDFVGANGSNPDATKWDESGTVDIQSNKCRVHTDSNDPDGVLTLKNAINRGKLFARGTIQVTNDGDDTVFTATISAGNSTDGWSNILSQEFKNVDDESGLLYFSVECLHQGGGKWNCYSANTITRTGLSLPNGLQIKCTVSPTFGGGVVGTFDMLIDEVYIRE